MSAWSRCSVLSFGLFGTLVDRERGLAEALVAAGIVPGAPQAERLLDARAEAEWEVVEALEEYVPYREVLVRSLLKAGQRSGTMLGRLGAERVADTAADWPLFPDAAGALARLSGRYRLALATNHDRAVVDAVAKRLGVRFTRIVTSADLEAYKPEPDLLLAILHEFELDEDQLLHVSGEPELDLFTAEDLGVPAVFVDRHGLGLPEDLTVALHVPDLDALASRLLDPRRIAGPRRPR